MDLQAPGTLRHQRIAHLQNTDFTGRTGQSVYDLDRFFTSVRFDVRNFEQGLFPDLSAGCRRIDSQSKQFLDLPQGNPSSLARRIKRRRPTTLSG